MELYGRLGQLYTLGVQARSTGGTQFDSKLQQQALYASGTQPPFWTWASRKDGKVVDNKWVWDVSMYPDFLKL